MKCFNLSSFRDWAALNEAADPSQPYAKSYPTAQTGVRLHMSDRTLRLGYDVQIAASEELLKIADPAVVQRHGTEVVVYRASLDTSDSGKLLLVPEKDDDKEAALLKCDLIGFPSIRYESADKQVAAIHARNELGMQHEVVLAVLRPFQPLTAVRHGHRWRRNGLRFYREAVVKERLPIKFDGQDIFYEVLRGE